MRYYYNRKATADESCDLSIYRLNKRGMLTGHNYTAVEWVSSQTGKKTRILLVIDVTGEPFVILSYTTVDREGYKAL